ncbi:MAG TPA: hypothetical protein VM942_10000 [Acidimicrobiales bacterium]|nr:hypothetical protein [Acidimicrobiales bacterium]
MSPNRAPTSSPDEVGHTTPGRWERLAPAGALVFLLTIVLGALAVGQSPPDSDRSARDIAAYFADHQGGHLTNTFLVTLGAFVFYPWFLARLWQALRRVEGAGGICGSAAMVGGITLLGPVLLQVAAWGAAALQAGETRDPAVAAALFDLGNMAFILFPLPAAVLVAATSVAAGGGTLLPGWLARAGLPVALLMVVGAWFGQAPVSFMLFGLWLALVALLLTRRKER